MATKVARHGRALYHLAKIIIYIIEMSDADYIFLLEETQVREDICEYDIGVANTLLQQQREEQQWRVDQMIDFD